MNAVTYESLDHVAVVTIDQPEKRNALSRGVETSWRRCGAALPRAPIASRC